MTSIPPQRDPLLEKLGDAETFRITEINGLRDLIEISRDITSTDTVEINRDRAMATAERVLRAHPSVNLVSAIYHADLVIARPDGMALVVVIERKAPHRLETVYFWLSPIYNIPNA